MTDGAKCNNKIGYFLLGPHRQEDLERSAKPTKSQYKDFADVSFRHWVLQRHIFIASKTGCETLPRTTYPTHYKNPSRGNLKDYNSKYE